MTLGAAETLGTTDRSSPSVSALARYLVGVAGLAFSLTILWLSMRAVMDIGGACASGGPYLPAVECPDIVIAMTPLSIFGLFLFGGLAIWGGASIGAGWAGLVGLAWPALFLSLGWNFLEYGLNPPGADPGQIEWSWLFCAIVFGVMGGVPLAVGVWGIRASGGRRSGSGWSTGRRSMVVPKGRYEVSIEDRRATERTRAAASARPDVTSRLERLVRLRDAGDLTDAEFQAAKRATLDEAGA
jgi:hypothetical protein